VTPRVIVGILALACVSVCGVLSSIASLQMANKVNERLPKNEQFAQLGWWWTKTLRVHREYKRLYPSGDLSRKVRVLGGLMFSALLACAWSLGFFGE
jgi:hypothetical protein